ncbi:MAG: hypothetical protein AAF670_02850 [Planctomycetota bacterium]
MMLFRKEIWECARILPVAWIVLAVVAWQNAPEFSAYDSQIFSSASFYAGLLGALLSATLAVMQVWPEQRTYVRGWILSQPVSRSYVLTIRTVAAAAVYLLAMLPVFLTSAVWMHRNFPKMGPVDPRVIYWVAFVYLAAFGFHPATVWAFSRPARWIGSKALPLLPALALVMLSAGIAYASWEWTSLLAATAKVLVLACIVHGVMFAWHYQSNEPSRAIAPHQPRWRAIVSSLSVAVISVLTFQIASAVVAEFVQDTVSSSPGGYVQKAFRFGDNGEVICIHFRYQGNQKSVVAVNELKPIDDRSLLDRDQVQVSPGNVSADERSLANRLLDQNEAHLGLHHWDAPQQLRERFQYVSLLGSQEQQFHWHPEYSLCGFQTGFFGQGGLVFQAGSGPAGQPSRMVQIDRNGFGSVTEPFDFGRFVPGTPFLFQRLASMEGCGYVLDRVGLFEINFRSKSVTKLLDNPSEEPIRAAAFAQNQEGRWLALVIHDDRIRVHDVAALGDETLPGLSPGLPDDFVPTVRWNSISLSLKTEIALPKGCFSWPNDPRGANSGLEMIVSGNTAHLRISNWRSKTTRIGKFRLNAPGTKIGFLTYPDPTHRTADRHVAEGLAALTVAPLYYAMSFAATFEGFPVKKTWLWVSPLILLQIVVAFWWTGRVVARRQLNGRHRRWWQGLSILVGMATPLTVLTVHPRISTVKCPRCQRMTRVDGTSCTSCGEPMGNRVHGGASAGIRVMHDSLAV